MSMLHYTNHLSPEDYILTFTVCNSLSPPKLNAPRKKHGNHQKQPYSFSIFCGNSLSFYDSDPVFTLSLYRTR